MKDKSKIRDIILAVAILVIAVGFYAGNRLINRKPAAIVEISLNNHVIHQLDLSKDTEIVIEGYKGGTNTLVIENGQVYISDASCPDKVCIYQGKISRPGEMIVCPPTLMIAKMVGEEE